MPRSAPILSPSQRIVFACVVIAAGLTGAAADSDGAVGSTLLIAAAFAAFYLTGRLLVQVLGRPQPPSLRARRSRS
jgi:hypothetical protein